MQYRLIQSLDQVEDLLACIGAQRLHPLLLVFFAFDDAMPLPVDFVELLVKLRPFHFVDFEFVIIDGLLNRSNHAIFLVLEYLGDLLGDQLFLTVGLVEARHWPRLGLGSRIARHAERLLSARV